MIDVAVVGGGPSGLMAAYHQKKMGGLSRASLFEASDLRGGKIITQYFESAPATYKAGVAEIYDYPMIGPDGLRDLVTVECGLAITPIDGEAVVLDGTFHNTLEDLGKRYGKNTVEAIVAFRNQCMALMSPFQYYEGAMKDNDSHPWMNITARDLLNKEIPDATARRFLWVMSREPSEHPGLFLVGDYMFDSTLNGLLDSADVATDLALSHVIRLRCEIGNAHRSAQTTGHAIALSSPHPRSIQPISKTVAAAPMRWLGSSFPIRITLTNASRRFLVC